MKKSIAALVSAFEVNANNYTWGKRFKMSIYEKETGYIYMTRKSYEFTADIKRILKFCSMSTPVEERSTILDYKLVEGITYQRAGHTYRHNYTEIEVSVDRVPRSVVEEFNLRGNTNSDDREKKVRRDILEAIDNPSEDSEDDSEE